MEDRQLKRAGLDYHEYARVQVHSDWEAFLAAIPSNRRFGFSAKAVGRYDQAGFQAGDALVFGPETSGLPEEVVAGFEPHRRLRLPMVPAAAV